MKKLREIIQEDKKLKQIYNLKAKLASGKLNLTQCHEICKKKLDMSDNEMKSHGLLGQSLERIGIAKRKSF